MRLFVAICLLSLGPALAAAVEPGHGLPIRPPVNGSQPVIALEFDSATDHGLHLAIYADGQAVVSPPGNGGRKIAGRIPEPELQGLLRDLIVEHGLLECRTATLEESIRIARRERRRPEPGSDAATTIIRVRTADSFHEIRCHALGLTASQLPDLSQVRDLFSCQQRLENVAAIIRAGGYEHVDAVLSAANQQLKRQAPQTDSLTSRHLSLVDLRPDGTRYLQFSRTADLDGLRPDGGFVMVSVYQSPGRPPEITITADPS